MTSLRYRLHKNVRQTFPPSGGPTSKLSGTIARRGLQRLLIVSTEEASQTHNEESKNKMTIKELNTTNGTAAAIQYSVKKNSAASKFKGRDVYNARVTAQVLSLQDVAEKMVEEGSKYKTFEITGLLTHFADVVARQVAKGYAVNVGSLFRLRPSIKGTFDAEEDSYGEGNNNKIVVRTTTGSLLRDVAAKAQVRRIDGKNIPEIHAVVNGKTMIEDTISSLGTLIVTGNRLAWDDEKADEGFFLLINGVAHKMTVVKVEDKKRVLLTADQTLEDNDEVYLTFATTKDGTLATYKYETQLIVE